MAKATDNVRVALIKGDSRHGNITRALDLIADQIDLRSKERIVIKPNFVVTDTALAVTHVDAVRAVLDFIRRRSDAWVTVAEGSALGDTFDAYRRFGYTDLVKEYKVELIDINRSEWVEAPIYDTQFNDLRLRLSKTVVESDLRISVGPPKTHDTVVVTLSLKNMVMGALIRDQRDGGSTGPAMQVVGALRQLVPDSIKNGRFMAPLKTAVVRNMMRSDKFAMHIGYDMINLNLYRLAPYVFPHLAVIDGFVGMEGRGPTRGEPVDLRCAVAGTDFLAVDTVAASLMGIDIDDVGYLHYCKVKGLGVGDLGQIEIVGAELAACRRVFRLPPDVAIQKKWRIANVERYL